MQINGHRNIKVRYFLEKGNKNHKKLHFGKKNGICGAKKHKNQFFVKKNQFKLMFYRSLNGSTKKLDSETTILDARSTDKSTESSRRTSLEDDKRYAKKKCKEPMLMFYFLAQNRSLNLTSSIRHDHVANLQL